MGLCRNDERRSPNDEKILQFWLRVNTFLNKPADQRTKIWWVEAEAIVIALYMHRLTRDPKYLPVFAKTYDFIDKYQTDWENGEWLATITPEGKALGDKAQIWKAGYHNGRAMMECLEILKAMK